MDTTKIEKLAAILLLLFVGSIALSFSTKVFWWFFSNIYTESQAITAFNYQTKLLSSFYFVFSNIINIGCAIWLYITAKSQSSNRWLWTFIGLFSGILGVILWFLWQIQMSLQKQHRINE